MSLSLHDRLDVDDGYAADRFDRRHTDATRRGDVAYNWRRLQ